MLSRVVESVCIDAPESIAACAMDMPAKGLNGLEFEKFETFEGVVWLGANEVDK